MSTLDDACEMLRALKRWRERMTPEERAAQDQRIKEDPMGIRAMFKPTPLFEWLHEKEKRP